MNVLKFLIIIVLIAAKSEQSNYPEPECYRNKNGFCRTFGLECDNGTCFTNNPEKHWNITTSTDCDKRTRNQVKVCYNDCPNYVNANCTGTPICAFSEKMQKCRVFNNPCHMNKVSCKDRTLKDWREAANKTSCYGIKPNARAVNCTVLN